MLDVARELVRPAELVAQRIEKRPRLADELKPLAPQRLVELYTVSDGFRGTRAGERRFRFGTIRNAARLSAQHGPDTTPDWARGTRTPSSKMLTAGLGARGRWSTFSRQVEYFLNGLGLHPT